MSGELFTVSEAASFLKLSVTTLNRYRTTGAGPKYRKLGRAVRYLRTDLMDWVEGKGQTSTTRSAG